jgi:hypothetical protein
MNQSQPDGPPSFWKSPAGLSLLVGGYFLLTEHRAHLFGALPYLLLLACPVMHLFMHKGHGHGGHGGSGQGHKDHKEGPSRDQREQ